MIENSKTNPISCQLARHVPTDPGQRRNDSTAPARAPPRANRKSAAMRPSRPHRRPFRWTEDTEDYKAFEAATSPTTMPSQPFGGTGASSCDVLWRLRRATAIDGIIRHEGGRQLTLNRRIAPPSRLSAVRPCRQRSSAGRSCNRGRRHSRRNARRFGVEFAYASCVCQSGPEYPIDRLSRYEPFSGVRQARSIRT